MTLKRAWIVLGRVFAGLGTPAALKYLWCHTLGRGGREEFTLHPRGIDHPLTIRRGTSDIHAFKLIYLDREYDDLLDVQNVDLVMDCGANVGFSSAYFLSVFPRCSVVAVEPDPGNYAMLERNLAPFGDRAKCVHAGVWSHSAPLALSPVKYREGSQWSRQVRECGPDEKAEFEGIGIDTLLAASGRDRISILKMDVEGAEAVIFSENYADWLPKVDTIAIELHDDSMFGPGSEVFHAAIAHRGFRISKSGELTICRQSQSSDSQA